MFLNTLVGWLAQAEPQSAPVASHPWLDWFKELPQKLLFEPWEAGFFDGAFWASTMHGVWVVLALLLATLLVLEQWLPTFGARAPQRFVKQLSVALTVLAFFSYFSFFNPNSRFQWFYNRQDFFHNYVGAKYFSELGYSHLYECTAVAEVDLNKEPSLRGKQMRDLLATDERIAITQSGAFTKPNDCKSRFTEERWVTFRSDVSFFESASRGNLWDEMKLGDGYSAPPLWTTVSSWFTGSGPATDASLKWLASIDVLLQAGALALFVWGFGWRVAAIASVFWAVNGASNFAWTGGAFLRQDWVVLVVAGLASARRRKFGVSGAALAAASLLRVYPVVLLLGPAIYIVSEWRRGHALSFNSRRFLLGVGGALLVLFPLSLQGAGVDSYVGFAEYKALHAETPAPNQMGLPVLLSQSGKGRAELTMDPQAVDPWAVFRAERRSRFNALQLLSWVGFAAVFAWTIYCVRRLRTFWLSIPLSLGLWFAVGALPSFTYIAFICMAPLVRVRRGFGPMLVLLAGLSQILLERMYWSDDRYVSMSYLFGTAALLTLFALSRRVQPTTTIAGETSRAA